MVALSSKKAAKDALSPYGIRKFRRWVSQGAILILDFDGTLVPIRDAPSQVKLGSEVRDWILGAPLARGGRLVLLSGRSPRDLARLTRSLGPIVRMGNHGASGRNFRKLSRPWVTRLKRHLKGQKGVWVEDKGETLCVHYRKAPNRARARQLILKEVSGLDGAKSFGGKCVINVLPSRAPDKAEAVLGLLKRALGNVPVVFVGDDETDERVFEQVRALHLERRVQGVSVGRWSKTAAPWALRGKRRSFPG